MPEAVVAILARIDALLANEDCHVPEDFLYDLRDYAQTYRKLTPLQLEALDKIEYAIETEYIGDHDFDWWEYDDFS